VYYVDPAAGVSTTVLEQLKYILTCPQVKTVGANLKYDWIWLKKHWGIEITNQSFDTTLVGSLLDENRSNSLNNHAKIYTSMGGYDDSFNKKYDKYGCTLNKRRSCYGIVRCLVCTRT
jgi:DNA polymerase I-like protein with 3'-5' exonuclease and polymerase domains